jgi:hypothetical protein
MGVTSLSTRLRTSRTKIRQAGTNYTSFATYLFDSQAPAATAFRRVLPRSDADSAAPGGDGPRFPGFTDTNASGVPSTLVFETRMNIKADGTVATTASEGLNPDPRETGADL